MEAFIGTIILFAGNFAPLNWQFCDGQAMAINSNQALFSILGTQYGGDGIKTFNLPKLNAQPLNADTVAQDSPKFVICVNGIFPPRA